MTSDNTSNPPAAIIQIDSPLWLQCLSSGRHRELCELILAAVNHLGEATRSVLTPELQQQFDGFVRLLFFVISQSSFRVPEDLALRFVLLNHRISSLAALTQFRTTDTCLQAVNGQPGNLPKILALYSARNHTQLDANPFFAANPALASSWYAEYAELANTGVATGHIFENLRRHFENPPPALQATFGNSKAYFGCSYVSELAEKMVKPRINQAAKTALQAIPPAICNPDPRKIAVFSAFLNRGHSVYRIIAPLIRRLRPNYHLTLYRFGSTATPDESLFDEIRTIESGNSLIDLRPLAQNDYQIALFPDVGMSEESIILANYRSAPIQIACLGHSVSTFGAEIDYFISGCDVERPDNPQQHYSERLVLLPGMGCGHEPPLTDGEQPRKAASIGTGEPMVVNCPANAPKLNHFFLQTLRAIIQLAKRKILIRFFAGAPATGLNDLIPFRRQLVETLGEGHVELVTNIPYEDYLARMQEARLSLDTYPFGGCNSVSDSLFVRVPILCREGHRWYNRIGPHLLRRAGLPELIAADETQYIETALRLIHDDAWREEIRGRLVESDLDTAIYRVTDPDHFLPAIDYLIANHEELRASPSRDPIFIS